jgi:hypothetical protein
LLLWRVLWTLQQTSALFLSSIAVIRCNYIIQHGIHLYISGVCKLSRGFLYNWVCQIESYLLCVLKVIYCKKPCLLVFVISRLYLLEVKCMPGWRLIQNKDYSFAKKIKMALVSTQPPLWEVRVFSLKAKTTTLIVKLTIIS